MYFPEMPIKWVFLGGCLLKYLMQHEYIVLLT